METILWPAGLPPQSSSFRLDANALRTESPLTRASQSQRRQGERWVASLEWPAAPEDIAAALDALLAGLDGPVNAVALHDHRRPVPRGAAGRGLALSAFSDGALFADGAGFGDWPSVPVLAAAAPEGAETIATSGWQASAAVLLAGDYIGLGSGLHMVLRDVTSAADGTAALAIRPRLRRPVAAAAAINLRRPTAVFTLVDTGQNGNPTSPGPVSRYAIQLVERLP